MSGPGGGQGPDAAREEFVAVMQSQELRPIHVRHVSFLALQLFDQLASLHGLTSRERLLLEAAAILHDIGRVGTFTGGSHQMESARLIRAHPWKNFTPPEVEIIAQIARYHSKSPPEMSHDEFRSLPVPDRRMVQYLASLLRLADALDRNHAQYVTDVRVELVPNQIVLHLTASQPQPLPREINAAYRKADLAVAMFQRDIILMLGDTVLHPTPAEPKIG